MMVQLLIKLTLVDTDTSFCVVLPEECIGIREQVERVVKIAMAIGPKHEVVTQGRKYVSIPWPTRDNVLSSVRICN